MSADLKDLHRQLDSELKEAERDWDQIVTAVEADRGKLKKIVDAKVNVKAFEELDQIEEWLDGGVTNERENFQFKNPQKGNALQKMTQESMTK